MPGTWLALSVCWVDVSSTPSHCEAEHNQASDQTASVHTPVLLADTLWLWVSCLSLYFCWLHLWGGRWRATWNWWNNCSTVIWGKQRGHSKVVSCLWDTELQQWDIEGRTGIFSRAVCGHGVPVLIHSAVILSTFYMIEVLLSQFSFVSGDDKRNGETFCCLVIESTGSGLRHTQSWDSHLLQSSSDLLHEWPNFLALAPSYMQWGRGQYHS